jgi:malonate-semialdehyde dehydrogenase (acetylating)/methylmalonate-semialdehyde dehydrogenase
VTGVLNVVHGDKVAVDAILHHPEHPGVSFVGSSDIAHYIYHAAPRTGSACRPWAAPRTTASSCPTRHGPGREGSVGAAYGSAGERCMALPVVVPVGKKTADELRER